MAFDSRPFQDRKTFEETQRCLAVTEAGEIVRVIDWARNDPETNLRVLIVAASDPELPYANGIAWQVREDRLAPVAKAKGAREDAAAWRAEQVAKKIENHTVASCGAGLARRI